jgi:hypothetical protein
MATYGQGISIYASAFNKNTGSGVVSLLTVPANCYAELMIHENTVNMTIEIFVANVLTGTLANPLPASGGAPNDRRFLIGAGAEIRKTIGNGTISWSYVIKKNT